MKTVRVYLLTVFLLLGFWTLILHAARSTSMVIDEGMHLTSGYSILRTGDYRLVEEHPPAVKIWAALPLMAVPDIPDPREVPDWDRAPGQPTESLPLLGVAWQTITSYTPIDRLVLPARAMAGLLGLLLGAVVYRWAADLWGERGGLLALLLLVLDPNILAHSAVVGTDLGCGATVTVALFLFARWMRRPTLPRLVAAGVTLGLALGTKTSAILLLPVVLLVGILGRRPFRPLVLLMGTAVLTLWALYGFEIGSLPSTDFPFPAASHLIPFLRLQRHLADGHPAFLLGENRTHGWWYYFPVAFGLKTPLPTLLLLTLSIALTAARAFRRPTNWIQRIRRWGPLTLFPLLYVITTLLSPLNIGYRHLLPVLPLAFIFIGQIANCKLQIADCRLQITPYVSRITHYALIAWLAFGTLRLTPHYLAYFNELAGGPDGGWRYLADSNTDWGQGYKDLARFQREHGLERIRLAAFVLTFDPAIYGVTYEPITPMWGNTPAVFPSRFHPPPGDYVISATTLDGIPLVDPEMYDWFRQREPDARIAHVLFYYRVLPQDPPPRWVAQCAAPLSPLSPDELAEGFGRADLRLAEFDCTRAWLYPDGGASAGWYVFYRATALETPMVRSHTTLAPLSYEQKRQGGNPPFRIYEWPAGTAPSPSLAVPEGMTAPILLDGPLAFLGIRSYIIDEYVDVETWWQVTEGPITRPLSIIGHLLNGSGELVGQDDGLGVSPVVWQPGDIIVQRHRFPRPPAGAELWLRTGVYWLDTMERWKVSGTTADFIMVALGEK